jgi:hypothetical protein
MKIEIIRSVVKSEETATFQPPIHIPCTDWQVDEPKAIWIRQQPATLPEIQYPVHNESWRLLEAHLESFAFNFDQPYKKGSLC